MKFSKFSGTARQYIAEYLDPDGNFEESPTAPAEAEHLWHDLNECFADDGGTGISLVDFLEAVEEIQDEKFPDPMLADIAADTEPVDLGRGPQ